MKTILVLASITATSALACGGGASSAWDARAATSLRAEPVVLLHDIDSGNADDMLSRMDDDSVIFDLDESNRPVRAEGRAQVTSFLRGLETAVKTQGIHFQSNISKSECVATASFGYCVIEFDQTVTAGGQTTPPSKYRGTLVARKVGDAWRWNHWHGSLREAPVAAK